MIQARPTTYNGIEMRSRLEAKFAAFLDESDINFKYEPRAYASRSGQYLPDFEVLDLPDRIFIEVRPDMDGVARAVDQMQVIWRSIPRATLLVVMPDGRGSDWWYAVDVRAWDSEAVRGRIWRCSCCMRMSLIDAARRIKDVLDAQLIFGMDA